MWNFSEFQMYAIAQSSTFLVLECPKFTKFCKYPGLLSCCFVRMEGLPYGTMLKMDELWK
jgi:hypothetical protein